MMNKSTFALLLAALLWVGSAAMLTGCNTIEGAGKDIEKGGEAIKDEAREQKSY